MIQLIVGVALIGTMVMVKRVVGEELNAGRLSTTSAALINAAPWAVLPIAVKIFGASGLPWLAAVLWSVAMLVLFGGGGVLLLPRLSSSPGPARPSERLRPGARRRRFRLLVALLLGSTALWAVAAAVMVLWSLQQLVLLPALGAALSLVVIVPQLLLLQVREPSSRSRPTGDEPP